MTTTIGSVDRVLERERQQFEARTARSRERFARAALVFPGGDTRAVTFYPPYPAAIESGQGIELRDLDGNRYADFLLNYTSLILGHRHAAVVNASVEALTTRTSAVAAPVPGQVELAEELIRRVPSVERVRFTNSGTESTMLAVWCARAFTGRSTIVKAIGGYHGSYAELDRNIRPDKFPPGVPETMPVRAVPFNDLDALRHELAACADSCAAVILEPLLASGGVIAPSEGYLAGALEAAHEAGALLILDEVISFRLSPGGYQALAGLKPDLTAFGKIIGGGFPVGAVGGRADVLEVLAPGAARGVSHSGTFNGNPVTVTAGLATLQLLDDAAYARLDTLGAQLEQGLRGAIEASGVVAQVTRVGSLLNVHFTGKPVRDFDAAQAADPVATAAFHVGLLNRGVFAAPRGMLTVALVTTESDVQRLVEAAADVLGELGR